MTRSMLMRHLPLTVAVLLSSAMLAACGGNPSTGNPAVYTAPTSIQGTVKSWTAGVGTVTAVEGTTTLSTAPLAAGGSFSLALPSVAAITPYLKATSSTDFSSVAGCTGALTVSDSAAQSYFLSTLKASAGSTTRTVTAATVTTTTAGTTTTVTLDGRNWIYTDRAFRLGGSASCNSTTASGAPFTVNVTANVQLSAGWNIVQIKLTGTSTSSTLTLTQSNVADDPTVWEDSSAPVAAASLSSSPRSMQQYASDLLRLMPPR